MESNENKENQFLVSNTIRVRSKGYLKCKSLETKARDKPDMNTQFRKILNLNLKLKSQECQQNTPEFGRERKTYAIQLRPSRSPFQMKLRKKKFSFNLEQHKKAIQNFSCRPLIKKSKKILDIFYRAIVDQKKTLQSLNRLNSLEKSNIRKDEQRYFLQINGVKEKRQHRQKYHNQNASENIFKLKQQHFELLKPFFKDRTRNQAKIKFELPTRKIL